MFSTYRGREFAISFENVLDYGAREPHVEWTVNIDGVRIAPSILRPADWSVDGLAEAVRRYIDVLIDGVAVVPA